jgi:hypothetical protein
MSKPPLTTSNSSTTSILDYNVINKTSGSNKKQILILHGCLNQSANSTTTDASADASHSDASHSQKSSAKLILRDVYAEKSAGAILELPISAVVKMLRNGPSTISLRYVSSAGISNTQRKKSSQHYSNSKAESKLDLTFISKEDCSEFVVSLSLLLPALKLGTEYFRVDELGRLIYEVYTLSKKGKRRRTLVLDPTEGTLTRLSQSGVKDEANIWSSLLLTSVPEHGNRRLTYTYPGVKTCDVEFPSSAIRSDFISNIRKIKKKLPLDAEFSMAEFKALQTILLKMLESFRARYKDPATLHIDIMRFLGKDVKLALSTPSVFKFIKKKFPQPNGGMDKKRLVLDIGTKFLQYGIMIDTNNKPHTRLIFRELGMYRFSVGGFGTIFDICCATWNVGEKKPPTPQELRSMVRPGADIYAIGLQECPAKHLSKWIGAFQSAIGAAGLTSMIDEHAGPPKKKRSTTSQSTSGEMQKIEEEEEEEEDEDEEEDEEDEDEEEEELEVELTKEEKAIRAIEMVKNFQKIMYKTVHIETMWGIHLIIVARSTLATNIMEVEGVHEATGIAGVMGNKGGCAVVLKVFGTTRLAFVTCHLAARMKRVKKRAKNFAEIISGVTSKLVNTSEGLDVIHSCDHVFWFGDLNYRIDCGKYGTLEEFNSVVSHCQAGK